MKRLSLLLTIVLGSPVIHAADLISVYREAQTRDAVYASARAAYQAGLEKLPQGRSLLLPSINLNANTTYNEVDTQYRGTTSGVLASGKRKYNTNGYTLTLNQPIYHKQNFAQYQQAKSQVTQAEAQFAIAQQDVILRVSQAYFDVLQAQDNLAFSGSQKAAISEQLAQAKRNFEVGTSTITDTHEAQARFDLTTAQEIAAQNDLEIKRSALQRVIGTTPDKLLPLGGTLLLTVPEPNNVDQWIANAEQKNYQLRIQEAAVEIATQEVERNRAGHYPTLDMVATYGDNSASSGAFGVGSDTQSKTIGLQLYLPIYQGGAVNSRVREALALQEKSRQDLEDMKRHIALQTRQAFLGVTSGSAQVRALEQALVSNQSSLDSTKLGFEVGVRTSVDVLNAQQQLFSAKRDLAQARYNYIQSQLKLRASVGSLAEPDLEQVNQWLTSK